MELEGKVWKDGKFWLIEVPILGVMTQGKTKTDALKMMEDSIEGLVECYFEKNVDENFSVTATPYADGVIGVTASDTKFLLSLSLIKQREKSKSTVREVCKRLGSDSPNAYAQYERGLMSPSVEKYEQLLVAANPSANGHVKVCVL